MLVLVLVLFSASMLLPLCIFRIYVQQYVLLALVPVFPVERKGQGEGEGPKPLLRQTRPVE